MAEPHAEQLQIYIGEVTGRYLHIAAKPGATKRRVTLHVDGSIVREFNVELANEQPAFWTCTDLHQFVGKEISICTDAKEVSFEQGKAFFFGDQRQQGVDYNEPTRPQFHFTACVGRLNDPNGLVYHDGVYHLYFQHNPYGKEHDNTYWGHATSSDLIHWKEQSPAIRPINTEDRAFSGSAVVDSSNTSGFQQNDASPIVAAHTSTSRGECIVYSNDGGSTFEEFEDNPVLKHEGRDPRLLWYEPGQHWVMAVYSVRDEVDGIAFHSSGDLKNWTFQSWIPGFYECPDLFELPIHVNGKATDEKRWILHGAAGYYRIGLFDGKRFTPETEKLPLAYSRDWYAAQTFSHAPGNDTKRTQIAWARSTVTDAPYNQSMFIPVDLTLHQSADGPRVHVWPIEQIKSLRTRTHELPPGEYDFRVNPLNGIEGELLDIEAEFDVKNVDAIVFYLRGVLLTYNQRYGLIILGEQAAPIQPIADRIQLRILVDRTTIEVFANDGQVYLPVAVQPENGNNVLKVGSPHTKLNITRLAVHELRSAWR